MKKILLSITAAFLVLITANAGEPCNCDSKVIKISKSVKENNANDVLIFTAELHGKIVKDRIAICERYLKLDYISSSVKEKLPGTINKLKNAFKKLESLQAVYKKAKVTTKKDFAVKMNAIYGIGVKILAESTGVLWGKTKKDQISGVGIVRSASNCLEGQTPPNHDCSSAASGVAKDCNNAIEVKMECNYYGQFGSVEEALSRLQEDQEMCIRMAENQQQVCQMANANCDYSYNPFRDMFEMQRAASMACRLKDQLTQPLETQTNTGH